MSTDLELSLTLATLRATLAEKRAARKAQTNSDLRAFEIVSEEVAAQSDNPLLEQSFRVHGVLERLNALNLERQHSLFGNSELGKQASQFDAEPSEAEWLAFQQALSA